MHMYTMSMFLSHALHGAQEFCHHFNWMSVCHEQPGSHIDIKMMDTVTIFEQLNILSDITSS